MELDVNAECLDGKRARGGFQNGKPRFGTIGDEAEILSVVRRMTSDGKQPTQSSGHSRRRDSRPRSGTQFSAQGITSIVIDLDRARRVRLDLRQRAGRLSESLAEVEALSKTDAGCAKINAQVRSLQADGLPQVQAIAEAVGAA